MASGADVGLLSSTRHDARIHPCHLATRLSPCLPLPHHAASRLPSNPFFLSFHRDHTTLRTPRTVRLGVGWGIVFPFLVYEWSVKEAVSSLVLHSLGSGNPVHLPSIFGTTDAPNFRGSLQTTAESAGKTQEPARTVVPIGVLLQPCPSRRRGALVAEACFF